MNKIQPILCRITGLFSLLFLIQTAYAQVPKNSAQGNIKNLLLYEPDPSVFKIVKKQPEFPGGRQALEKYLLVNVHYPPEAKKSGVTGRVFVNFIVETDGRLTGVDILKGLGFGCDEEAIRVINAMPRWKPGGQSGRPLRVMYHLPILFGIDYSKVNVR